MELQTIESRHNEVPAVAHRAPPEASASGMLAYAAPAAGLYFFYIPMFSILPEVYAKDYALPLGTIALIVLSIRLFDGVADAAVGYFSDRHRSRGGSRKTWTLLGCVGSAVACYFLFNPATPVTPGYYLGWSLVYFFSLTTADIPHLAWGGELSMGYEDRSRVFGIRTLMVRLGISVFYALPLLPGYRIHEYTPEVLHDAVIIGAGLSALGIVYMLVGAPGGAWSATPAGGRARPFLHSIVYNKPLLIHFLAFGLVELSYGMWFGLLTFFLDGYLHLGSQIPILFLAGFLCAAGSAPLWIRLISATSKPIAWSVAVAFFVGQLLLVNFMSPGGPLWLVLVTILVANVCLAGTDTAVLAILGDVIDYGKLRFRRSGGGIYFALNALMLKVGLGVGSGLAIGIAGAYGFDPSRAVHSEQSIMALKFAFIALPSLFALVGIAVILRAPLTRKRCAIIRRRLQSVMDRAEGSRTMDCPVDRTAQGAEG